MFDEIAALADDHERLFQRIAQSLVEAGEFHRLFDLRLIQERRRLGLPLDRRTPIDDVEEPLRSQVEAGYLAACREVGELLLEAGRLREAWMYLRPAGDKFAVRRRLSTVMIEDDRADELIELALFEGVDPERGYAWLLGRNGTCNAITTLDGMSQQLGLEDLKACAAVLVRHVYRELQGNLRGHLTKLKGLAPSDLSVLGLIDDHPELLAGGNYHLDVSHLGSTVRYGRLLTEPSLVTKAWEMAEYGSRLPAEMQYAGEAPFEDQFPAHRLLFEATLGRNVEAAVEYFGEKARAGRDDAQSTAAVETYLILLTRVGRAEDALATYAELVPRDRQLSAHAPTLLELAQASGNWELYEQICREREDLLGFAAGILAREESPRKIETETVV
jgi:tetratricopeptide (TPR) repeat protein